MKQLISHKFLPIAVFIISSFLVQSCFVAKEYHRPENLVNENNYRTDSLTTDSLSLANIPWSELFTDKTLQSYISEGLENNLDIRTALQNINISEAYMKQGKAGYFPTINASGSYTYSNPSLNAPQGAALDGKRTSVNLYEISGNLSWEADIWGKIRSNQRATNATFLQSISAHQAVKSELVSQIATTYFQLLALDEQKSVAEETIENRRESVETIKALKEAGNVTEVAVQQTEAQLLSAQSLLLDIENQIKVTENSFCILLGESPHEIERGKLENQTFNQEIKTGFPIQLLSNRPDVRVAEYGLIQAFELTNVARSNFYPSLRIGAEGGVQSLDFEDLFSANSLFASIIGSLTQPLLNGRQIKTQYEVSMAQKENALLTYKRTILLASEEVSNAVYDFDTQSKKINLKKKEFEAYDNASKYSEELLKYGMADYLEVLTAKQSALNAQLDIISSEFARLNSIVQVYRALGGGWK